MKINLLLFLSVINLTYSQVGIGNTNPMGALEITSTTEGIIIPRVTLTSTTVSNPVATIVNSEIVYNINTAGDVTPGFYFWRILPAPARWVPFGGTGASGWLLTGNAGTNASTNFLGTTDDVDLIFKRNNIQSGKINSFDTAFGLNALIPANASGRSNSAFGLDALSVNSTGGQNSAFGKSALRLNTSGYYNSAFGEEALMQNVSGQFNTAIGIFSLQNNNDFYNTAVGSYSLAANTGGRFNTGVGMNALTANTTGFSNTAIGYGAYQTGTSFTNSTAIGFNSAITASYMVRIGDATATSIGGQVGWTTVSDKRFKINIKENVAGLNFIMKLKPVTYNLDLDAVASFMKTPASLRNKEAEKLKEQMLQTGFLAQDVEQAAKEVNFNFSGIDAPKNETDHYGLRYAEFVVPLVKAVQEQQVIIDNFKEKIELLEKKLLEIENKMLKK